ncbi:MAG TPA: hypothetical protein VK177_13120 [Flavobacteriales bacterium]|nr:hypothetical protein [Flavobacteriales bacterium]
MQYENEIKKLIAWFEEKQYKQRQVDYKQPTVNEFVRQIKNEYAKYMSADLIDDRFALPPGFTEYLELMPATYSYNNGWIKFFDAQGVFEYNEYEFSNWVEDVMGFLEENKAFTGGLFWLVFGNWSDKHAYFICCDKGSPDFGKVVDGHDNNPACHENFIDSDISWESFIEFIETRDFG